MVVVRFPEASSCFEILSTSSRDGAGAGATPAIVLSIFSGIPNGEGGAESWAEEATGEPVGVAVAGGEDWPSYFVTSSFFGCSGAGSVGGK